MRHLHPDSQWTGADVVADDEVVVATTRNELAMLAGAISEALEAVEEWEFDTRVGATPDEIRVLRDCIGTVLRSAYQPE